VKHLSRIFSVFVLFSAPALAQEADTPAAPVAPAPAPTAFTDAEVEQFAKAALAVQDIRNDAATSDEDKQAKMAAAVRDSGLAPARFNEIAAASRDDKALMERIQTAGAKAQQQAAATETPAAAGKPAAEQPSAQ
jgi:hypothetical protein